MSGASSSQIFRESSSERTLHSCSLCIRICILGCDCSPYSPIPQLYPHMSAMRHIHGSDTDYVSLSHTNFRSTQYFSRRLLRGCTDIFVAGSNSTEHRCAVMTTHEFVCVARDIREGTFCCVYINDGPYDIPGAPVYFVSFHGSFASSFMQSRRHTKSTRFACMA